MSDNIPALPAGPDLEAVIDDPTDAGEALSVFSRLEAQAAALAAEAAALTDAAAVSNAIVPVGDVPAVTHKRQLAEVRGATLRKMAEITALQEQMRTELDRQMAQMRAIIAPLKAQAAHLEEQAWTADLYLGRDEEILVLADGKPAPADTPLTLRQEVLSMDEETAAHADQGGIDARHLDVFDEWIIRPENLGRVLPELKGVVALVPRRRGRDYADPWLDKQLNEANRWTYFLIRNGEKLWRMKTDFVVGKHLIPATDEFTGLFVQRTYNPSTRSYETTDLIPGTKAWNDASEKQDRRQRHYMRMALILQGLVDRTPVFHPLPDAGLNLLAEHTYADGRAVLLRDAEAVLTDGRPDFFDWLTNLNSQLRVGMRILGAFNSEAFKNAGEEYSDGQSWSANDRVTPRPRNRYDQDRPATGVLYNLEGRTTLYGEPALTFKFERSERWIGHELRRPKTRATCAVRPDDRFILPFDLVNADELTYYLGSRRQRHAYEYMFPLLKAALAAKKEEAAAEEPFRHLLAGALVNADTSGELTLEEASSAVAELVTWWKLKNSWHRPLVTIDEPELEAKAIKEIVAEHAARTSAQAAQSGEAADEAAMVSRLLELDPTIMVVGRTRAGGYLAFAPQPRTHADAAVANLWVTEYTTTKTGRTVASKPWSTPGPRMDKTRVLFTAPAWEKWDVHSNATTDLTDTEIDILAADLATQVATESADGWRQWNWGRPGAPKDPHLVDVLGVTHDKKNSTFTVWVIDTDAPAELATAPKAADGKKLAMRYAHIDITYTKSARDGVVLQARDQWSSLYWHDRTYGAGATPGRPWGRVYDGKSRDPIAVLHAPAAQAKATARDAAIGARNEALAEIRKPAEAALWVVKRAWEARAEAQAYARFLEDFADPELWEGHRKTLKGLVGPYPGARDIPSIVWASLYTLTDQGVSYEGLTVRDALMAANLEALAGIDLDDPDKTLGPLLGLPLSEPAPAGE